jgi:hypothetical protein
MQGAGLLFDFGYCLAKRRLYQAGMRLAWVLDEVFREGISRG